MFRSNAKIPGWFVALVVLITAAVTVYAMLRRGGNTLFAETASYPRQVAQVFSPAAAALNQGALRPVASTNRIPSIHAGMLPTHAERGPCTACHKVVDLMNKAIPMIRVMASLPHQYRGGLCINCHQISGSAAGGGSQVAAQVPLAPPAAPATTATEGAWLGMEVVPITPMTAGQYNLPPGTSGLVVAEAEAVAAVAGVQAGDVVVQINGAAINNMGAFLQATQNGKAPGGQVTLLRGGQYQQLTLGTAAAANGVPAGNAAPVAGRGMGMGMGGGVGGGAGYRYWSQQQQGGTPPCMTGVR